MQHDNQTTRTNVKRQEQSQRIEKSKQPSHDNTEEILYGLGKGGYYHQEPQDFNFVESFPYEQVVHKDNQQHQCTHMMSKHSFHQPTKTSYLG